MSVELAAFVLLAVLAYIVLMTRNSVTLIVWFVVFVVYSLIIRIPEVASFSLDMKTYYRASESWPPPLSLYTLREPLVWIGTPLLRRITGSRIVTFIAVDIVVAMCVMRAMKLLDDGSHTMISLSPTIVSSYVFLLGQQNVIRQHLALALLLWAIAARGRHRRETHILLALSIAAHNAAAVFLGYWLDIGRRKKRQFGPLLTLIGVTFMGVFLPLLRKSSSVTGLDVRLLYVTLTISAIVLVLYAKEGRLPLRSIPSIANYVSFLPAFLFLGPAQFERLSMMFVVVIGVDLYRNHRALGLGRCLTANMIYGVLVVPVFFFPTVRAFLG